MHVRREWTIKHANVNSLAGCLQNKRGIPSIPRVECLAGTDETHRLVSKRDYQSFCSVSSEHKGVIRRIEGNEIGVRKNRLRHILPAFWFRRVIPVRFIGKKMDGNVICERFCTVKG